MSKCKVIAMCNQKGGVGKTTVTMNLGIGLARAGKRVLLVDSDSQGSLSAILGWQDTDSLPFTLTDVYENLIMGKMPDLTDGVLHNAEGVDLMPSNITLSNMGEKLNHTICRESKLKQYLDQQREHYDYILIDCLPALSVLLQNALTAADSIVIPMNPHYLSVKGYADLFHTIEAVRISLNERLSIAGILFTVVDNRIKSNQEIMKMFRSNFGNEAVFETFIPKEAAFQRAAINAQNIFQEFSRGKGCAAFEMLTAEIIHKMEG